MCFKKLEQEKEWKMKSFNKGNNNVTWFGKQTPSTAPENPLKPQSLPKTLKVNRVMCAGCRAGRRKDKPNNNRQRQAIDKSYHSSSGQPPVLHS